MHSELHVSSHNTEMREAGLMAEQQAERNGTTFEEELNKEPAKTREPHCTVRGACISDAGPKQPPDWSKCNWGREFIVGFGNCGFAVLTLIEGNTPESLVVEMWRQHIFHGDPAVVDAHFKRLYELHIGKPAALLSLILDPQESNYVNPKTKAASMPTPNEAKARADLPDGGEGWEWTRDQDGAWVKQSKS